MSTAVWLQFWSINIGYTKLGKFFDQNLTRFKEKFSAKVSFFLQCSKMQLITFQNFHIQTCFSQFLWFFSLKCWFKGQIISRIHLRLPNSYKLMIYIEISMEIGMWNFWNVINGHCTDEKISLYWFISYDWFKFFCWILSL